MAKIEKLTPEQTVRLGEWHAEWFAVGSSTEPADRPRAERAITGMYARINEPAPHFMWVDSPATGCLMIALLGELTKPESSLESSLGSSLESSLESSLWSSLESSLESSLWSSLESSLYGQTSSYWVAFYAFCRDVVGVQYDPQKSADLDLWVDVAKSCDWWWPYKGLVIVSERPKAVHWESDREQPRLHCTDGPALLYRDGWPVYAIRGVRVKREHVEEPLTAAIIQAESNVEVRRVLLEKYGTANYIRDIGAKLVHEDRYGKLYHAPMPNDEPLAMVHVLNSTPEPDGSRREYWIRVDPRRTTAHDAVASTFRHPVTGKRLTTSEYNPVMET